MPSEWDEEGNFPGGWDLYEDALRSGYDAVSDGHGALLVWREGGTDPAGPTLLGTTVAPGGVVKPTFTVSAEPGAAGEPRLASSGHGRSLVVYHRNDASGLKQAAARFIVTPH